MKTVRIVVSMLMVLCFGVFMASASSIVGHKISDNYMTVLGVPMGAKKADIIRSLGEPTKTQFRLVRGEGTYILSYGGTDFYCLKDYKIKDEAIASATAQLYRVVLTNRDAAIVGNIAVGDSITKLAEADIFDFQPDIVNHSDTDSRKAYIFYGRYIPRSDYTSGIWFHLYKNNKGEYIITEIDIKR